MRCLRRSLTAVVLLLVFSSSLQAQDIRPGIELSGGYASFDPHGEIPDNFVANQPGLLSYGMAVFTEIPLTRALMLRPALRYVRLGESFTVESYTREGPDRVRRDFRERQWDLKYRYVTLPVRLRYSLAPVPLYVIGGVSPGYLVSGKLTTYSYGGARDRNITRGIDPRWNVNVSGGFGSAFSLDGRTVFVETSYSRGLIPIPSFGGNSSFQPQEMMLRLGYRW